MASEYRFFVRVVILIIVMVAVIIAQGAVIQAVCSDLSESVVSLAGVWLMDENGLCPMGTALFLLINGLIGVVVFRLTGLIPFDRRWRRQGRCLVCGYDLRGGTGDTCPECGDRSSPGMNSA